MLYVFDEINQPDGRFLERCVPLLSEQRREKVASLRFPSDKKLSAAAYLLLRLALREQYGIEGPAVFGFGANGKPFLRDHPGVRFNLSHCRAAAACVVADSETGVDVQHIGPVKDNLARRVLTAKEYEAFNEADDPAWFFCGIWTVKESYLKKTGQGIGVDLTALAAADVEERTQFQGAGYCGCVTGSPIALRTISANELLTTW